MDNHNQLIGKIGEQKACNYLKLHGYTILNRNFRAKTGELDIIAKKDNEIVFIEVKTRMQNTYGKPSEAVDYFKQNNIINTAKVYLMRYSVEQAVRFDVIEVILKKTVLGYIAKINHIKSAF